MKKIAISIWQPIAVNMVTPDMSDNNFANNVSGVAMKYKLLGTLNNIANKQRKFKKALQERNRLIFDLLAFQSKPIPSYVDIYGDEENTEILPV